MKKTLLLTHEYYPFAGGVARYCYHLFKYYDPQDYIVITDHPSVQTKDNIIHLRLRYKFIKPSWLIAGFSILRLIKKYKIEKIVTPNILPLGVIAYFINKLIKIPYIISLHGLDIRLALKNKPKLTKKILKAAAKIIVNSQDTKNVIENLNLAEDQIVIIYPTTDLKHEYDEYRLNEFKEKFNIQQNDYVLLTVGRLNLRKGQDLVIKALNSLKNSFDIKYLIVGAGEFKQELESLIKGYNLENNVFIIDNVSDQDLIYYYKLADIFVLPNRYTDTDIEGFGMVFLEAASCHLPIIAGNSGGVVEIFTNQQNAILIANENIGQLTTAITTLLNNPDKLAKLAQQAFLRSKEFPRAVEQSLNFKKLL